MANDSLPPILESRVAPILRATPDAKESEVRNILRDGHRILGLEDTLKRLNEGGLNRLALAVCLHPMPIPENFTAPVRR